MSHSKDSTNKQTSFLSSTVAAIGRTIRQWAIYATTPITNAVAYTKQALTGKTSHHYNVPGKLHDVSPEEKPNAKNNSRTVYMTDWDETVLDSGRFKLKGLQRIKHKIVAKPTNKYIPTFEGAVDFFKKLNAKDIKTAIVSNKDHHKLVKQSHFLGIDDKFDAVVGHDRANRISMRKGWNGKHLLEFTLKKLGIDIKKGMEPVNVVFVGDTPRDDMRSAHELRKHLKQLNKESNVTSILFNSRNLSQEQINALPEHKRPNHVVENYQDLEQVVSSITPQGKTKHSLIQDQSPSIERTEKKFVQSLEHQTPLSSLGRS